MSDLHDIDGIAIVGAACRVPGAEDIATFWENVLGGRVSVERLAGETGAGARLSNETYVPAFAGLRGVEQFAADFFGISAADAAMMDPQHRIFLEIVWTALESAGYCSDNFDGAVGVFAGCGPSRYAALLERTLVESDDMARFNAMLGTDVDFLATRVAYRLDLRGPAVTIQTACSTSLVAVHYASQSLLLGECDLAIAGGVSLPYLSPCGYRTEPGMVLSPAGLCRPFDADADGTVPAGGAGAVVLKRLRDALSDGDTIVAVIRASAVGNDGGKKVGFTAPSIEGQARTLSEALLVADIAPSSIGFIEAHGTGTQLGDPIEVAALLRAYQTSSSRIALGSVKANIGHLDTAAGVVGLIKAALVARAGEVPPQAQFQRPNSRLALESGPFFIPRERTVWPVSNGSRRAAVSSFGIGGTNAHVILEEPPAPSPRNIVREAEPPEVLVCSAESPSALTCVAQAIHRTLEADASLDLRKVAYTLQVGRREHPYRAAVTSADAKTGAEALVRQASTASVRTERPPVVFLFAGHGREQPGMGSALYHHEPVFAGRVDECATLVRALLGFDIRDVLVADRLASDVHVLMGRNSITQAALFVLEYALAQLWGSWGVTPDAVIGHSSGEYVAACTAGVLGLSDALALAVLRGQLIERHARGRMAAVALAEESVRELLVPGVAIAAVNSTHACVLSGDDESIDAQLAALMKVGVDFRRLQTPYAGHSSRMDAVVEPLVARARDIRLCEPTIPYVSNVTGTWMRTADALDPGYWGRHTRATVRFADGLGAIARRFTRPLLLELGPGRALGTFAREVLSSSETSGVLATLQSNRGDEVGACYDAVAAAWASGVRVDWARFNAHRRRGRVALPTYPFERRRYWFTDSSARSSVATEVDRSGDAAASHYRLFRPEWSRSEPASGEVPSHALVFGAGDPFEAALIAELARAGVRTLLVRPTGCASGAPLSVMEVRPSCQADDYIAALRRALDAGPRPMVVIHAWGLDERTLHSVDAARSLGFESVLGLVRAYADAGHGAPGRFVVVSNGVHAVREGEHVVPDKAMVLGPCRVAPREYPNLEMWHVDIGLPSFPASASMGEAPRADLPAIAMAVASVAFAQHPPRTLAVREGAVYAQRLERASVAALPHRPALLRQRGVYVITGGLGGLGGLLARHLAARCGARLVLVGRSRLPPREDWAAWRDAFGPKSAVSQRLETLLDIEAAGGEALVATADVADRAGMAHALDTARARFGGIDGVFHVAGVAGGGTIAFRDPEAAARVFAPKVEGTQLLLELLPPDRLDFMALFSSTTVERGDPGQVDHCAANAYLDATAVAAWGRRARILSIGWDTWKDVGAAARSAAGEPLGRLQHAVHGDRSNGEWFDFVERAGDREVYAGQLTDARAGRWERALRDRDELTAMVTAALRDSAACVAAANDVHLEMTGGVATLSTAYRVVLGYAGEDSTAVTVEAWTRGAESVVIASGRVAGVPRDAAKLRVTERRSNGRSDLRQAVARGLGAEEGIAILEAILHDPSPRTVVSTDALTAMAVNPSDVAAPRASLPPVRHPRPALPTPFVAPRDPVEATVAEVFGHALGIAPVGAHDGFFDLGGSSLAAIRVVNILNAQLSVGLSASSLVQHDSPEKIAMLVRDASRSQMPTVLRIAKPRLIVLRNGSTDDEPLVLIHPAGGTVLCYRALVNALGGTYPVLGIQAHGLEPGETPHDDLAAMAAEYVDLVRRRGPVRRMHVGGLSFGGAAAFAVAAQAPWPIGLVFMIDTPSPQQRRVGRTDVEVFAYLLGERVTLHVAPDEISRMTDDEKLELLVAQSEPGSALRTADRDQLRRVWNVCRAHAHALWRFAPQDINARILFVTASERDGYTPDAPDAAWRELLGREFDARTVPGNHMTVLEPPHVAAVARLIDDALLLA